VVQVAGTPTVDIGTRQRSGGEPRSPRAGGGVGGRKAAFLHGRKPSYVALLTRYYNLSLYFIIKICKLRFNGDILVKTGITEKTSLSFFKKRENLEIAATAITQQNG
jgi:hypothetical protein